MTCEEYYALFLKDKERMEATGFYLSPIKFLFNVDNEIAMEDWTFNDNNWNGCDVIRRYLVEHWYEPPIISKYAIYNYYVDDDWYVIIAGEYHFYIINWYKDRGHTSSIIKDGQPITFGEYIELYNMFEQNVGSLLEE